jgi:hypothetical protein
MIASYKIRRVAGNSEELSCLQQLEDECAAMYFNIVHGAKLRRRFTTEAAGKRCEDYILVAEELSDVAGQAKEREIPLFEIAS